MYTDAKRRDIQLLLAAGVPQERISDLTGVSVRTICRIGCEPAGPGQPAAEPQVRAPVGQPRRASPGRPSMVEPYRDAVLAMLANRPKLKSLEVLRRLRERGYAGGKSAVYELVRHLRPQAVRPICRFEGVAGESSQHDFGEVLVEWTGGGRTRVHFFASSLKHSRYTLVTRVLDQRVETLVRTLAADFDRPKTIATQSDPKTGAVLAWNPTFAEATARLGVAVEVCWPYQPRQKGSVENLVGWVKGSFFKQRRFLDEDDLEMQLQAWHEEVNERRANRATERIPGELLPRATGPALSRAGGPDRHDDVPDQPLLDAGRGSGLLGDVAPVRRPSGHRSGALPGRASAPARAQSGLHPASASRRPAGGGERQTRSHVPETPHLLELGRDAERFLTELLHVRPRQWQDDVGRLHELLQACGSAVLRDAFRRVAQQSEISVAALVREVHEFLLALAREDVAHRAETRIQRCVRKARFPQLKTVEEIDFAVQPEPRRTLLGSCFGPEFVADGRNLILTGRSGRGKTHLGDSHRLPGDPERLRRARQHRRRAHRRPLPSQP